MKVCENTKDCRHEYRQILQGYTYVEEKDLYIKHFNESDLGYLDSFYKKCEKEIRDKGIDGNKEKLEFLKQEGYWNEDDENEFLNARMQVQDAKSFQQTLQDGKQKADFEKEIDRVSSVFKEIANTRQTVLNPTVESFCDRQINEQYVRISLFKDKDCKNPSYSEEEFSELSYIELSEFVTIYNDAVSWFDDANIRKIGVNGFFLNSFLMCNNDPVKFYGKNIIDLTNALKHIHKKLPQFVNLIYFI